MGDTSKKVKVRAPGAPVTYERPRILVLGTVAELTRTAKGFARDSVANGSLPA
jgi:hypothetical protein